MQPRFESGRGFYRWTCAGEDAEIGCSAMAALKGRKRTCAAIHAKGTIKRDDMKNLISFTLLPLLGGPHVHGA